jgi:hypothetical protein
MDLNTLIIASQHVPVIHLEVGKVYRVERIFLEDIAEVRDPRCYVFLSENRGTCRIWTAIPPELVSHEIIVKGNLRGTSKLKFVLLGRTWFGGPIIQFIDKGIAI